MNRSFKNRKDGLIILLYTVILLLFCSGDSFLRMDYARYDSAWFFMGGKAMMEGLVPYVDFSDSKGPLLWIIYGLGYLISPHSFHGMLPIEIAFYWATFYLIYKTALLFSIGRYSSLLVCFLMGIAFFFPVLHNEMRSEDFCNLFYALSLYSFTRLYLRKGKMILSAVWVGVSIGCALMIKFNICAILVVPTIFTFGYFLIRPSDPFNAWRYASGVFAGLLAVLVPILGMCILWGNIFPFFNEYFINTLHTMANVTGEETGSMSLVNYLNLRGLYILVSLVALVCVFRIRKQLSFRWCIFSWFTAAFILSVPIPWVYYLLNLSIFWFFLFVTAVRYFTRINLLGVSISGCTIVAVLALASTLWFSHGEFYDTVKAREYRRLNDKIYRVASQYTAGIKCPATIAYLELPDLGLHVKAGLLPAVKYWALQSGVTDEMRSLHISSILEAKPTFIVATESNASLLGKSVSRYAPVDTVRWLVDWNPEEAVYLFVRDYP